MTRENQKRCIAYPCTGVLIALLVCLGNFQPEGEPDLGTLINGADILAKVGAHDKAIQECEKVLERDPGNLQAHLILAFIHDRREVYASALEHYDVALELCSSEVQRLELRLAIADLHRRHGKPQAAILDTLAIEEDYGCSAEARLVRGLAEQAVGRLDAAIDLFQEVASERDGDSLARLYLGEAYLEHGLFVEAESTFSEMTEKHCGAHDAWYRLAVARARLSQEEGMFEALENAATRSLGTVRKSILIEPAFEAFSDSPRFQEYLHGVYEAVETPSSEDVALY